MQSQYTPARGRQPIFNSTRSIAPNLNTHPQGAATCAKHFAIFVRERKKSREHMYSWLFCLLLLLRFLDLFYKDSDFGFFSVGYEASGHNVVVYAGPQVVDLLIRRLAGSRDFVVQPVEFTSDRPQLLIEFPTNRPADCLKKFIDFRAPHHLLISLAAVSRNSKRLRIGVDCSFSRQSKKHPAFSAPID